MIELKRSSVEIGRRRAPAHHQPGGDLQQGLLQHRAARVRGQRLAGAALRHRPARRSSSSWSGRTQRAAGRALAAGALLDRPLAEMCEKPRLLDLIRNFIIFDAGQQEGAAAASVRRREGGAGAHRQARGRRHLAHPGQRQEHPDGAARQVAAGARSRGPHPRHHRPRRAGQADRGRDEERRRHRRELAFAAHHLAGGVRRRSSAPPRRACCAR